MEDVAGNTSAFKKFYCEISDKGRLLGGFGDYCIAGD